MLAELTHRCPLQCPYCSNPVELDRAGAELTTEEWKKVLSELAEIGVLQIHFSGGEPTARKDLVELVQHATDVGLYTNLITSAVLLTKEKLSALADAGLCHVQISFQGNEPVIADRVAGLKKSHEKKIEAARWTRELDLPLTVNAVMHRQNLHQLADIIQMAVDLDADRLEVANVQYYGWALKNRAALMPTLEQIEETSKIVEEAQVRLKGVLTIDYVVPDYYALRPKKCMGGWGRQFFNISPAGKVLPCHAAESITGLEFESVRSNHSIAWIWQNSEAFNRYRGTGWMPEPCKSLRLPRGRFRRLPLPGLCADGRCRQYRSGLLLLAAARENLPSGRSGRRIGPKAFPLSQLRRRHAGDGRRPWRLTWTRDDRAPIPLRR